MSDTPRLELVILKQLKFSLGRLVATQNALGHLTHEDILTAINRHAQGDWGTLDAEDWRANEVSLRDGSRLLSVYFSAGDNAKFYVITEADRSATTILLPEDY